MGMLINFLLEGIGVVLIGVLTIFIFLTIHESEHFMGFILNKVNVYAIFIINLFFIKENEKWKLKFIKNNFQGKVISNSITYNKKSNPIKSKYRFRYKGLVLKT